ncbi:MAG: penicillin-binding protein 2 [Pseudomonadota bacterium]
MAQDPRVRMQKRMGIITVVMFMGIVLLGVKAIELQILESKVLSSKAIDEYTGFISFQGRRGEIFDAGMKRLGTSIDALSVAACPKIIVDPAECSRALAKILDMDRSAVEKHLREDRDFVWIKRQISPTEVEQIKLLGQRGLIFRKDATRFYPNRELAAQVLGFTGKDGKGLEGVEHEYNDILTGREAKIRITKDGNGQWFDTEKGLDGQYAGDSLVLTIDGTLQHIAESALVEAVKKHKGKSGMALIMRPGTGELLAMAHYPEFNPNAFSEYSRFAWRNRAVIDPFEPGSTMKVFVAATAMDKGYCTPGSTFYCENGKYKVGRYTVHDTHSYGWLTLSQIISLSSNIGAVKVSEVTGRENLYASLTAFGFGQKTGIGCPGETQGVLIPFSRWSSIDAGAIAFGQGVSVSAVQLISGISAIANRGFLMKPLMVKEIISSDGQVVQSFAPVCVRQAIAERTAVSVRDMMLNVVTEEGTGGNAAVEGYSVCGKTGTAQKVTAGTKGYSQKNYTALFVGFAPATNPEVTVLVIVDEPRGTHYGGEVAAPAFKKIMTETLHYLNVPPDVEQPHLVATAAPREKI